VTDDGIFSGTADFRLTSMQRRIKRDGAEIRRIKNEVKRI
jgi:hypothetical protein